MQGREFGGGGASPGVEGGSGIAWLRWGKAGGGRFGDLEEVQEKYNRMPSVPGRFSRMQHRHVATFRFELYPSADTVFTRSRTVNFAEGGGGAAVRLGGGNTTVSLI